MGRIIKDALILFVITAVAGLLLAMVNEVTKGPIEDQKQKAKAEACQSVFPGVTGFNEISVEKLDANVLNSFSEKYPKISLVNIYDASGEGYVLTLSTKEGYGDNITFSMGIANDGTLNGVAILTSNETVGLGLEAEKVLVPQFAGKNVESFTYTKTGSTSDSEVDAISSATITTRAFVNAVNAGLEFYNNNLK